MAAKMGELHVADVLGDPSLYSVEDEGALKWGCVWGRGVGKIPPCRHRSSTGKGGVWMG